MGWTADIGNWVANHHERGGLHFVAFVTVINVAQIGWGEFRKVVRFAELKYTEMLALAQQNLSYADHRRWLHVVVKFFLGPVNASFGFLWMANYALSIAAAFAGLFMLYLEAFCPWDFLLLVPPLAYSILTYSSLAILAIVLKLFNVLVNKFEEMKKAEMFLEQQNSLSDKKRDTGRMKPVTAPPRSSSSFTSSSSN